MPHEQWSQDRCDERHNWMKWGMSIIFLVLLSIIGMIGWMIQSSGAAMQRAETAVSTNVAQDVRMTEHWEATQRQNKALTEMMRDLRDSMDKSRTEIVAELRENRALVTRMYEERKAAKP
jgi:hypothetical protein